VYSKSLWGIDYVLCAGLSALILLTGKRAEYIWFPVVALIPATILLFTSTSGATALTLYAILPFFVFASVLLLRVRDVPVTRSTERIFFVVNIVNLLLGFGMVLGVDWMKNFIGSFYAYIDSDFVDERMLALNKPVLTFYTHSIAGFMLYLFFYMNLRAFQANQNKIRAWMAGGYLILIASMFSVTGMVFFCFGVLQLLYVLWGSKHRAAAILVIAIGCAPFFFAPIRTVLSVMIVFMSENRNSGLTGRYLQDGTMYYDMQYLKEHPLRPFGASIRADIMFGDSGQLEYLLRGSLPLLILIYGCYWLFLRANLKRRVDVWLIFLVTFAFEFGATTLTYLRFLWLIPFLCVYLNSLTKNSPSQGGSGLALGR
jgi:hypothetical protein